MRPPLLSLYGHDRLRELEEEEERWEERKRSNKDMIRTCVRCNRETLSTHRFVSSPSLSNGRDGHFIALIVIPHLSKNIPELPHLKT